MNVTHFFEVHATHATHTTHAAHTHVFLLINLNVGTILFILVYPFAEISLDERVLNLFLRKARPVLFFLFFLAKNNIECSRRELFCG